MLKKFLNVSLRWVCVQYFCISVFVFVFVHQFFEYAIVKAPVKMPHVEYHFISPFSSYLKRRCKHLNIFKYIHVCTNNQNTFPFQLCCFIYLVVIYTLRPMLYVECRFIKNLIFNPKIGNLMEYKHLKCLNFKNIRGLNRTANFNKDMEYLSSDNP